MSRDIVVSIPAKDFTGSGPGTVGADPAFSNLQVTHAAVGHVEWTVTLPTAGKWRLHALMAAMEKRPCTLTINGVKQASPILGEVTSGWQSDKLQWFVYGPYDFNQGANLLRIDFTSCQSCLKEFGFSRVATLQAEFPWRQIASRGNIIGLAVLRDRQATLLGIGSDFFLYARPSADVLSQPNANPAAPGEWARVPGSDRIIAITQLHSGELLGVGTDNALYTRATLAGPWVLIPASKAVKSVAQRADGTLVGVGMDNFLYTRAALNSPWVQVPASGSVTHVCELASGVLVGIGTNRLLYTRDALTDPWLQVPGSGAVTTVAELPDGTLLATGADGYIHAVSMHKSAAAEPADKPVLHATGLEDYGYWLRWKQELPASTPPGRPFRRGVIWR